MNGEKEISGKESRTFSEEMAGPLGMIGASVLLGPNVFVDLLLLPREAVVWVLMLGCLLLFVSLSMAVGNALERRRVKRLKADGASRA